MRARVMRMLASNAFESPAGTTLLGISAASGSVGGFSHAHDRATAATLDTAGFAVAALAASAFRLPVALRAALRAQALC